MSAASNSFWKMDTVCMQTALVKMFPYSLEKSLPHQAAWTLDNGLIFLLNGNICNNSN